MLNSFKQPLWSIDQLHAGSQSRMLPSISCSVSSLCFKLQVCLIVWNLQWHHFTRDILPHHIYIQWWYQSLQCSVIVKVSGLEGISAQIRTGIAPPFYMPERWNHFHSTAEEPLNTIPRKNENNFNFEEAQGGRTDRIVVLSHFDRDSHYTQWRD